MRRNRGFSIGFKEAAIKKLLTRGNQTIAQIAEEVGVSVPSIYQWRKEIASIGDMKKATSPKNKTATEKLQTIILYEALAIDKRGEFLRKNGLYDETITEWKNQIVDALKPPANKSSDKIALAAERKKTKELERQLRRKDKALAEASALLILKKKADLIWGTIEDEE